MLPTDCNWYVVVSHPRREDEALRRLGAQGYASWMPRFHTTRTHARKREDIIAPLFPRYLFVGLRDGQSLAKVCATRGVLDLVRTPSGLPLRVQVHELDRLTAVCDERGILRRPEPKVRRPMVDKLRITDAESPLTGMEGLYLASAGERVTLLLDMLGGKVACTVAETAVSDAA